MYAIVWIKYLTGLSFLIKKDELKKILIKVYFPNTFIVKFSYINQYHVTTDYIFF